MHTYWRQTISGLTISGTVTSDGFVIGSVSCPCGWGVGPGAFIGTPESADAITSHGGCTL